MTGSGRDCPLRMFTDSQHWPAGRSRERAAVGRFGSAANLNVHVHCLVLDGVYRSGTEGAPEFVEVAAPTDEVLQTVLHKNHHPHHYCPVQWPTPSVRASIGAACRPVSFGADLNFVARQGRRAEWPRRHAIRRHLCTRFAFSPCAIATLATDAPAWLPFSDCARGLQPRQGQCCRLSRRLR